MEYIKKEFKKLGSLILILLACLIPYGLGINLLVIGTFLLIEHMWSYGRFDFFDILGHETFGIILVILGLILLNNLIGLIFAIMGYLLGCNFKWSSQYSPYEYLTKKLNFILKKYA